MKGRKQGGRELEGMDYFLISRLLFLGTISLKFLICILLEKRKRMLFYFAKAK